MRHNHQDLVGLAELPGVLERVYRQPGAWRADTLRIARAWRRAGRSERAIQLLEADPGAPGGRHELADLYRARRDWSSACSIWEALAGQGDAEARECLAKYHEHIARDLPAARRWAASLPDAPAVRRRLTRLERKLGENLLLPLGWEPFRCPGPRAR